MADPTRLDNRSIPVGTNPHTTTTSPPTTVADVHFGTKQYNAFRLFADCDTVSDLNVRIWQWDEESTHWYALGDSDDGQDFTGADEARDFYTGRGALIHVQIQAFTGTSVALYARGLDQGVERV
jgi:hypothetical protein